MAAKKASGYSAEHIQVLEGLDPVRKRPGMYIGSTGPTGLHHLVWEVVDNAVDEAMAGYCTRIDVTLLADGGVRVADNGRGIPVDEHPQYKGKSAAEIVMTTLHAGGKFGGGGYKVSGGLHGVGVSVVNALSSRLVLEVDRDGITYRQEYAAEQGARWRGAAGRAAGPAEEVGNVEARPHRHDDHVLARSRRCSRRSSSAPSTVTERLQVMAFLNRGLAIALPRRAARAQAAGQSFQNDAGIVDFVRHLNHAKEPLFKDVGSSRDRGPEGEVEVAWQWNTGYHEGLHCYANGISTTEGGMHAEGFKRALTAGDQPLRQGAQPAEGEGRHVPGRRRARGPHRDRVGAARRPAVRGPDQGEARQHRDPVARRARDQRALRPLARGASEPGQGDRRQGVERGAGAQRGEAGARADPPQDRARRRRHARQARRLRGARPRRAPSCSSSRATRPAVRRATRATRRRRRSSRCAARSSTSSARRWTRSSPTPRSSR